MKSRRRGLRDGIACVCRSIDSIVIGTLLLAILYGLKLEYGIDIIALLAWAFPREAALIRLVMGGT